MLVEQNQVNLQMINPSDCPKTHTKCDSWRYCDSLCGFAGLRSECGWIIR